LARSELVKTQRPRLSYSKSFLIASAFFTIRL
jgi:hypothetical protein